ncbi:glycoprotein 3-alpha-L-fucosyltransferase A-like [Ylistrum balloti]|uniref:glycoprotein 3-alpha-L-fucosyltransferase A-like n=1 Tax=Ylistrum balloti TaxID=509963 RepID=UPI002905B769|nr:glycoprotein 3-alpha-L-fucosyltransferase A-like [Ylistrum balloti]
MKQLYRYFIAIVLVFLLMTGALHYVPRMLVNKSGSGGKIKCLLMPTELENQARTNDDRKKWPAWSVIRKQSRKTASKLPYVWDNDIGDDRIVSQMEFVPGIHGEKKVLWTRASDFNVNPGDRIFSSCPVKHCTIIEDDNFPKIDAKMWNMQFSYMDIPRFNPAKTKQEDQVWIIYNLEGPLATPDYYLLDNLFNWTASYRRDSTIVTPYERWRPYKDVKPSTKKRNYAAGKSRKVAMFISNCDTTNGRMNYVHELQKYIDIHVYGACGDGSHQCDRFENQTACIETLRRHYKFYLAFENCNCRHYITEKFFVNALSSDVIPVVMGAHPDDYKAVAPPDSFIHVEDFNSPKDLAKYLHTLDKNDDLYNEYFRWKGTGSFIDTKFWCRLCALLNDPDKPSLVVESLSAWWRPPGVCIREDQKWKDL